MHVGADLLHAGGLVFALIEVLDPIGVHHADDHDSGRTLHGSQGNVADKHGRVRTHQFLPRFDLRLTELPYLLLQAI